jgi:hypothetical protein
MAGRMLGKFYPERHMRRIERLSKLNCWMDVFEGSYFEGRMRRLFGPIRIAPLSAGSVIVGPEASAQLIAQRRGPGRQVIVRFPQDAGAEPIVIPTRSQPAIRAAHLRVQATPIGKNIGSSTISGSVNKPFPAPRFLTGIATLVAISLAFSPAPIFNDAS